MHLPAGMQQQRAIVRQPGKAPPNVRRRAAASRHVPGAGARARKAARTGAKPALARISHHRDSASSTCHARFPALGGGAWSARQAVGRPGHIGRNRQIGTNPRAGQADRHRRPPRSRPGCRRACVRAAARRSAISAPARTGRADAATALRPAPRRQAATIARHRGIRRAAAAAPRGPDCRRRRPRRGRACRVRRSAGARGWPGPPVRRLRPGCGRGRRWMGDWGGL